MQKIRALARRGSGRVVPPPPPTRRASTCGGQDARGSNSSSQQLLLPPPSTSAAPEGDVGSAAKSGSTNALAYLGKKIFGSHRRHHHQHASAKNSEDQSAREDRHAPKHRSADLIGVFSSRRPRTGDESLISGGTSLMDMQAFTHVNRTTPTTLGRHDDAPGAYAEELTPRRRASEIVRELDSVLGFFLPDASEGVVTGSPSALAGHSTEQGKQVMAKDQDAVRHCSIQPSPPTPPQPRRPLRSPSPTPRRHQKKRSQSSFTRPTSRRVDRKIVNHSDLDLCILLGDIARRNRGIDISPPRKRRTHRKSGLAPPPPPRCPKAADVFVVEDTVKRNRRDALDALTSTDRQEKKDAPKLVRSRKVEQDLARVVVVEEVPAADQEAEVATVRGWIESLPSLLQIFCPPEDADPFATIKRRSMRDAPVVSHDLPSEETLSRLLNSQTCLWGLFPLPPARQEVSTKRNDTGLQSRLSPSELKKREKKIRLSPSNGTVPPGKPWKFKDLEKLPSVEPADRFARIVRWVADVREALALEAVPSAPRTAKAPEPYVPYWHFP